MSFRAAIAPYSARTLCLILAIYLTANKSFCQNQRSGDSIIISKMQAEADRALKISTDSGIRMYRKVITEAKSRNFNSGIASAMLGIGLIYINQGKYDESIRQFNEALPFSKRSEVDKGLEGLVYNNTALAYTYKGDYQNAIGSFLKAASSLEKNFPKIPPNNLVLIYNNIGAIYDQLDQDNVALIYLNKGETIARKFKFKDANLGYILTTKGNISMDADEHEKALTYFKEAVIIAEKYGNIELQQAGKANMGNIYLDKKEPEVALEHLRQALNLTKGNNDLNYVSIAVNYAIGEALFQLRRYEEAKTTVTQAISYAEQSGTKEGLMGAHQTLANVYEFLGQYKDALRHQQLYIAVKDSMLSKEKIETINNLELKYRTAEKDKQLAEGKLKMLAQENNLAKKNLWIGGIAGGAILLGGLVIGIYRSSRHKQRLQNEKIKSMEREHEISQLLGMMKGEEKERNRIARELHDGIVGQIYGIKMNVNSVQQRHNLEGAADVQNVLRQLDEAAQDVRQTAHNLMPEVLMNGGLGEAIEQLIEKAEESHGLNVSFQIYGDIPRLNTEFELSIYRIVQELLTNIVKHAKAERVIIQINYQQNLLILAVEDNGVGISDSTKLVKGMGLNNISSRVKAFNGIMEVDSSPERGTMVHIEFSIKNLKKATENGQPHENA